MNRLLYGLKTWPGRMSARALLGFALAFLPAKATLWAAEPFPVGSQSNMAGLGSNSTAAKTNFSAEGPTNLMANLDESTSWRLVIV